MKITLPIFLLLALTVQSQTQINALSGIPDSSAEPNDGSNYRSYSMFVPETVFDQSSAGFDQNWDVSEFTTIPNQIKWYLNTIPTDTELFQFPGALMKIRSTISTSEDATVDSTEYISTLGLMSFVDSEFILNYNMDNAYYGSFPQTYGDLHLDTTSGAYTYGEYSGTFAGTMITEVDAYGDMVTDEGTFEVTRLKTVQTLQLSYPGFGNVGTFVQTTYRYYRELDLWPLVKSTNTLLNVPLLGLDTNTTEIEKAPHAFLSAENPLAVNDLSIVPNPVSGATKIITSGQNVFSVIITDNSGKEVFTKKGTTHLDLSALPTGTYLARIQTSEGMSVKKIIKK